MLFGRGRAATWAQGRARVAASANGCLPVTSVTPTVTRHAPMCYSAQITAAYQKLVRMTGATLSLQEFAALYAYGPRKKRPQDTEGGGDAIRAGCSQT